MEPVLKNNLELLVKDLTRLKKKYYEHLENYEFTDASGTAAAGLEIAIDSLNAIISVWGDLNEC